jgi:hypothetical protein
MSKVVFVPRGYWNRKTMKVTDTPTDEQLAEVKRIADELQNKYAVENGCPDHPDHIHQLSVNLFNDNVEIHFSPLDSCMCPAIVDQMRAIREYEQSVLNRQRQNEKQVPGFQRLRKTSAIIVSFSNTFIKTIVRFQNQQG